MHIFQFYLYKSLTEIFEIKKAEQKSGESWTHTKIMNSENRRVVQNRYSLYLLSLIRHTIVSMSVPVIVKFSSQLTCSEKVCWMKQKCKKLLSGSTILYRHAKYTLRVESQ